MYPDICVQCVSRYLCARVFRHLYACFCLWTWHQACVWCLFPFSTSCTTDWHTAQPVQCVAELAMALLLLPQEILLFSGQKPAFCSPSTSDQVRNPRHSLSLQSPPCPGLILPTGNWEQISASTGAGLSPKHRVRQRPCAVSAAQTRAQDLLSIP